MTDKEVSMKFTEFMERVEDTFVADQDTLRYGQTVMNVLYDVWPEKYTELRDTTYDCFYTNTYLNLTLEKLEKEWNDAIK